MTTATPSKQRDAHLKSPDFFELDQGLTITFRSRRVENASPALAWFLGGLPLLIVVAWWLSRRPPQIAPQLIKDGGQP